MGKRMKYSIVLGCEEKEDLEFSSKSKIIKSLKDKINESYPNEVFRFKLTKDPLVKDGYYFNASGSVHKISSYILGVR